MGKRSRWKNRIRPSSKIGKANPDKLTGGDWNSTKYRNAAMARRIIANREKRLRETLTEWGWRKHREKIRDKKKAAAQRRKEQRAAKPALDAEMKRRSDEYWAREKLLNEQQAQRRAERLAALKAGTLEPTEEDMPYWNHLRKIEIKDMEDIGWGDDRDRPRMTEEESAEYKARMAEEAERNAELRRQHDAKWERILEERRVAREAAAVESADPAKAAERVALAVKLEAEFDRYDALDDFERNLEDRREYRADRARRRREARAKLKAQHESALDAERALIEYQRGL